MSRPLTVAIAIPTSGRPESLDRALATIVPQARAAHADVLVVDDGPDRATADVCERHGVRYAPREGTPGLNSARNTALKATAAELICFVDDDVEVWPSWLDALVRAAGELPPDVGVLTGPIRPRIYDHRFRACGRESGPITALELGGEDVDVRRAWGSNMAIRRGAFERVGAFDPSIQPGDEEDWQQRWLDRGGRIRYIAAAGLDHVRRGDEARLRRLVAAAFHRGRGARRYDTIRGVAPSLTAEAATFARCALHGPLRLCFMGPVTAAHSLGRIAEALRPTPRPASPGVDDFTSGQSGTVGGRRDLARRIADAALDARTLSPRLRLRRVAARMPASRRILVVGVQRTDVPNTTGAICAELSRSRHAVTIDIRPLGDGGKFDNVNAILADHRLEDFDHMLVIDDDIELPRAFLDVLVLCADRGDLALCQPAHRLRSHAAWPATRRTPASWRETTFVEIGPATLFERRTFDVLLPFPAGLRMGWGLDVHWSAVARERGWRLGVVDAVAIGHVLRPVATGYSREGALDEAREFLASRPYLRRDEVRTLSSHR